MKLSIILAQLLKDEIKRSGQYWILSQESLAKRIDENLQAASMNLYLIFTHFYFL